MTLEDVLEIVRIERPDSVIVQYGGQTPLKLACALEAKERITKYIEITCNRQRIQAGLGYCTPAEAAAEFERAKTA